MQSKAVKRDRVMGNKYIYTHQKYEPDKTDIFFLTSAVYVLTLNLQGLADW